MSDDRRSGHVGGSVHFHQFFRTPLRINLVTAAAAWLHCMSCRENDDDLMMMMMMVLCDNLTRVRKTTS